MGSRGASAGTNSNGLEIAKFNPASDKSPTGLPRMGSYAGIGLFSKAAFESGESDARNELIEAINKYNAKKGRAESRKIIKLSDSAAEVTLGNGKRVPTKSMLDKLGVKMPEAKNYLGSGMTETQFYNSLNNGSPQMKKDLAMLLDAWVNRK